METTSKIENINFLRAFAIIVVVLGHSIIIYSRGWDIFTPAIESDFFHYLKEYINTFQMPLFFFISGYIYFYNRVELGKYDDSSGFIVNKFKRLIIPYLTVATFYMVPIRKFINYQGYEGDNLIQIFFKSVLLTRDIGHLWYVIALFWIFFLFKLLEESLNKKSILFNFSMIFIVSVIGRMLPNLLNLSNAIYFSIFFYLGYIIRGGEFKKIKVMRTLVTLGLFVLHLLAYIVELYLTSLNIIFLIKVLDILIEIISGIFGTLFFYCLITGLIRKKPKMAENKVMKVLNDESFSIYLFHSPILYIVLYLFDDKIVKPYILVLISFVCCLFGSLIISYCIQKSGRLNFVVGKSNK